MTDKYIITGSGKCGTSFLVHFLTKLGLDTGFTEEDIKKQLVPPSHGGLEWPIRGKHAKDPSPTIIKDLRLSIDLLERAKRWNWNIKHVYICIRNFGDVAEHRFDSLRRKRPVEFASRCLEKGENGLKLELAMKGSSNVGFLMGQLADTDIPYTFIRFPRMIYDAFYCEEKLMEVAKGILKEKFYHIHKEIADPEKIRWGKE